MSWFKKGGDTPKNDNTSPAHDKARRNYDSGKSPEQTRRDLDAERRKQNIKPTEKK